MAKDDEVIDAGRLGEIRKRLGNNLPYGWELTTLGAAFKWGSGGTPKRTDPRFYGGDIPWLIIGDLNDGVVSESDTTITEDGLKESSAKWVEPGSVLLAMYGSIGKLGIAGRRLTTNQAIAFTKPDPVDAKYLFYYLMYTRGDLASLGKGATQKNISQTVIKEFPFVLAPLDQQKRIVAEIEKQFSRLDEAVANLKRVKANLKRYKAAVLKAAVEGKLTEEWRKAHPDVEPASKLLDRILAERRAKWEEAELAKMEAKGKAPKNDKWKAKYKAPVAADATNLPELPEGWVWATLPQLGELNRGKSKHRPRDDKKLYGGPYPFIQTGDVRKSEGTITEFSQTYSEVGLRQSRLWPEGTLCITIAANIAETGILKFAACFPDSVVGFLHIGGGAATRYVEYFIRTAREELERFAPATAQKNINLQVLESVAVPLPPIAEQGLIVTEVDRHISLIRETELVVNANLKRAERLRQSILRKAFSG